MQRFVMALLSALAGAGVAGAQPITYEVRGDIYQQVIVAHVNGQTYEALRPEDGISHKIMEADFDGDGQVDLLHSWSGGGNCCAPQYEVLSLQGGRFVNFDHEEFYGWSDPVVEHTGAGYRFVIETTEAGTGHTDLNARRASFAFTGQGIQKLSAEVVDSDLPTLAELSVDDYDRLGVDKSYQLQMPYDLDGSGQMDMFHCGWWERWGLLTCSIRMSSGREVAVHNGCVRLGVLASRTAGLQDLVCGREDVLRYDPASGSYQAAE